MRCSSSWVGGVLIGTAQQGLVLVIGDQPVPSRLLETQHQPSWHTQVTNASAAGLTDIEPHDNFDVGFWRDPVVNDVDAANPSAPAEYYYVVRAVNAFGMKSATSNTAGKWTKAFSPGLNAFSIPLEPYYARNISWYADVIPNVERIRWMDPTGHWITHLETMDEGTRDTPIEMGRGYEIFLTPQTFFTFNGYPASMIRFQEGLGDTINYRTGLSAQTIGSDVILNWYPATGATQYRIFRSEKRNGLHDSPLQPVDTVPAIQTTWTDLGVLSGEGERYYIVIPVDSLGELGSGTYGVGVFTKEYLSGSDTFALPLKPLEGHSLDWYCDYIQNVVGIASMLNEFLAD